MTLGKLGIVGGTGWLGGVLARGMLTAGVVSAADFDRAVAAAYERAKTDMTGG